MNRESNTEAAIGARRRRIVLAIEEFDGPITIDELVDTLQDDAAVDADAPGTPDTWQELHRELFEFDLPALADVGLIQFDAERGLVGEPGATLTDGVFSPTTGGVSDATTDEDGAAQAEHGRDATRSRWPRYYLTLSVVVLLSALVVRATGSQLSSPSTSVVAGLFLALSLLHTWSR
jgi:hypothetical protein